IFERTRNARLVVDEQDPRHAPNLTPPPNVHNPLPGVTSRSRKLPMQLTASAAARRLAFLERVVRATAEQSDHEQLLRTIIDEATETTGTQVCSLYLWDDLEKLLILTATNGLAQSGVGNVKLG